MTQSAGLVQRCPARHVSLVHIATIGQKMTDNTEAVLERGGQRLDPVRGRVDCEVERGVAVRGDLVDVCHWGQGGGKLEVEGQTRAVEDGVVVGQNGLVDVDVEATEVILPFQFLSSWIYSKQVKIGYY